MKGPARSARTIAAIASSIAAPPTSSATGSRLPCTGTSVCSVSRATPHGTHAVEADARSRRSP